MRKIYVLLTVVLTALLLFAAAAQAGGTSGGLSPHYLKRKTLFEKMPVTQGKIVFLGDSLTEDCDWNELFQATDILNRGISGDTTAGALLRLDRVIAEKPRKVFVMLGVNDMLIGVAPEDALSNYREVITRLRAALPGTKICVQSVLPVSEEFGANRSITGLNDMLKALAAEKGVEFIDLHRDFRAKGGYLRPGFTFDGIHLNGEGYAAWKKALVNHIK